MTRDVLKRLFGQPLVQFTLIGAVIFGLYSLSGRDEETRPSEIRIGAAELRWLHDTWQGQFGRAPSAVEMRAALKAHLDEEMRYREGLALGLDRDDTIVRRRLAQKYDFLLGAEAGETAPAEAQLRAVFEGAPQRYSAPGDTRFCQVYFGAGAEGLRRAKDALAALSPSAARSSVALTEGRDRLPYPRCYEAASSAEAARDFGAAFAGSLSRLPVGTWQGPVQSGYGFHAVLVSGRKPARPLSFVEARGQVEADWRKQTQDEARRRNDRELATRYRVTVDERALRAITGQGGR